LTSTGGARHITGFTEIVRHEGRLNEARMPLKIVGFDLKRLLHILPLGIKMFLKGKVPNPFTPAIAGIGQIRRIFASRQQLKPS
jgi:succinate dehydrogenase / fumarate reductase iron-sulfur subunit